jgi:hypothetical protein
MDLISGTLAAKQASLASQVDFAVARKMLDQQQMAGDAAIKMIQAAGQISAGDPMVAAATGLGGELDVTA